MVPDLSFWSCWVSRTQQLQKLKSGTILMLARNNTKKLSPAPSTLAATKAVRLPGLRFRQTKRRQIYFPAAAKENRSDAVFSVRGRPRRGKETRTGRPTIALTPTLSRTREREHEAKHAR
jgi:hypothetical protein